MFAATSRNISAQQGNPSDRITVGLIGTGRQAIKINLRQLLNHPKVQVVSVCDVDSWRLQQAKEAVDEFYGNSDCHATTDWREVIARDDIDAIMNSTTDQWHVPISLEAVKRGKHVSCEKPLTLFVSEGRELADAVAKAGVVFRTDTECRTNINMHRACELVRNGLIGKIKKVKAGVPGDDKPGGNPAPMPVPEELDYETWVGPAQMFPYTVDRVHPRKGFGRPGWMRCLNTCEGMITNWGTHLLDVAQLGLDRERTTPVEVEGSGTFPEPGSGLWDVLIDFKLNYRYADGVELEYDISTPHVIFEGEDGWIRANWFPDVGRRQRGLEASDPAILETDMDSLDVRLPRRDDKDDFINSILTGEPTMIDAEIGHRTCSVGQIGHIAIALGRKLRFNPQSELFEGDDQANKMLTKPPMEW